MSNFLAKLFMKRKNLENTCMDVYDTSCEIQQDFEKTNDEYAEFLDCNLDLPVYETPFSEEKAIEMFLPSFTTILKDKHLSKKELLLGSIFGDIIGEPYEYTMTNSNSGIFIEKNDLLSKDNHFTDDTVLTIATLDALINNKGFAELYKEYHEKYPRGYGWSFTVWANSECDRAYGSYGNGSAMRVSPCAIIFDELEDVIRAAYKSAVVTHNHEEGIKGAVVTAVCIWLARFGSVKDIEQYMYEQYDDDRYFYRFSLPFEEMVKKKKHMPVSCQSAVPFSIRCALDSCSYKDFMKNLIEAGHDVDTDGAIAGAVAAGLYGFPYPNTESFMRNYLPDEFINMIVLLEE